jgi:hypothetical protein
MLSAVKLNVFMLSVTNKDFMLIFVTLGGDMMNVVMLSVIMLSVALPKKVQVVVQLTSIF